MTPIDQTLIFVNMESIEPILHPQEENIQQQPLPIKKIRVFEPLTLQHRQAMALKSQGIPNNQIANRINPKSTPGTIKTWFCKGGKLHDAFEEYKDRMLNPVIPLENTDTHALAVGQFIKEKLAPKAVLKLDRLIDSQKESIALTASIDSLDRAGYRAPERILTANVDLESLSSDQLDSMLGDLIGKYTPAQKVLNVIPEDNKLSKQDT